MKNSKRGRSQRLSISSFLTVRYFVLSSFLLYAVMCGPTWLIWLQAIIFGSNVLNEIFYRKYKDMLELHNDIKYFEEEDRKTRIEELNPHKWKKE